MSGIVVQYLISAEWKCRNLNSKYYFIGGNGLHLLNGCVMVLYCHGNVLRRKHWIIFFLSKEGRLALNKPVASAPLGTLGTVLDVMVWDGLRSGIDLSMDMLWHAVECKFPCSDLGSIRSFRYTVWPVWFILLCIKDCAWLTRCKRPFSFIYSASWLD